MGDDITIGVTEIVNNIEVTAQPNDQIVDISVTDNADNVTLNITPTVVEVNVNKGSSFAQWGDLYGTLSDQTDLQNALNLKANLVDGKVPASELPSYVDDIIEVANYAALPATGETGKIYVTLDNNKIYRWSGSVYIEIASNSAIWGAITGTLSSQTDLVNALNLRVPYTGATSNVNLGEYGLTSGFLGLDTTPTSTPTGIGTIYWDAANRTAALIDGDGDTTLQIGQEQRILVHNNTGSTLTDGQVVYVTGSTGNVPSVSLANASSETTSAATIGVVTESIAQGADGFITTSGIVNGLNTLAFNEGDLLWLGTTAGTFTATKPISPNHLVLIGYVIKKAGGNGSILVKIQNTQELEESSDVLFTSLANNQVLTYESATDLWKNKSIATVLGYTPANDASVVKVTTDQNIRGIKTFLGDQTATTLKLIVADYYNDGFITSDNGMLRLLNGTTELFNLASTGDLTAKSFVKTGGTASQFLKANGTVDSTTYLSGTVAIANGGTGATTADSALSNLGGTTVGKNIFTSTNPSPVTTAYLKVKPDNSVEWLEANAFRIAIGAGTGNGTVTSVEAVGSYGGLTLTGTVTGSGQITLGGTPTGTWPISITGNASSVNTVQVSTNADFYLTFADANNGSPTSEFLYTIGSVKVNPSTGALTAGSFVKSGGTSSQYLMADGSVSTGSGGTVTGTGTTNYIPKFTGASAIGNSLIYDNGTNVGIGTTSPTDKLDVNGVIRGLMPNDPLSGAITAKFLSFSGNPYGLIFRGYATGAHSIQSQRESSDSTLFPLSLQPLGGNVGIGTTSPAAKLTVNGQVLVTDNSLQGFYQSRTSDTVANGVYGGNSFVLRNGATSEDLNFDIFNRSSSAWYTPMVIKNTGNVGIGTTSPNQLLHIEKDQNTYTNLRVRNNDAGSSAYTMIGLNSSGNSWGMRMGSSAANSNRLDFVIDAFGSPVERMSITSGGNVGIGTTSPTIGKLQINAVAGTDTFLALNSSNTGAGCGNILFNENGTSRWNIGTTADNSLQIYNQGVNAALYIRKSDSNVGIGTTSPATKLDVVGAITASGGFFNSDMRLKDLTDYDYNVSDIKPITYLWKDGRDDKKHVGYSAQEVQKVMPDAVNEGTDGMLSVNYVEVLVAKIAELENRIKQLEK